MTPQEAIAVIGTGATTALGWDAPASFAAVRAGVPGFAEHPYLVDSAGDFVVAALAPAAPADTGGADRFGPMIDRAFGEALKPLAAAALGEVTIPCVIGIPRPRPGLPDDLEERIRADLMRPRAGGRPAVDVVCIAGDHAAGLLAIRSCWEWMQRTGSAIGLAGGVDSWISSETIEWLEGMEWLHAQRTPFGFIPGEAAAFCLLASPEAARRLGAVPRLLIRAVAAAAEPVPIGH